MRHLRGLTLIELMVTLSVLAILAVLGYPSMTEFIDKHRVIRQVKALTEMAELARSEAMKRSGPSSDKTVTMTVRPGDGTNWYVGLRHGTTGCATSVNDCMLNQAGTNVPQRVTATDSAGVTMTEPTGAAVLIRFDFRGLVTGSTSTMAVTMQSPKGRRLQLAISPIGTLTVCSPSGEVTGYPTCA